jgi:hypothetical protein
MRCRSAGIEHEMHVITEQIDKRRAGAAVRDAGNIDPGHRLE